MKTIKGTWTLKVEKVGKVSYQWTAKFKAVREHLIGNPSIEAKGITSPTVEDARRKAENYIEQVDRDRHRFGETVRDWER